MESGRGIQNMLQEETHLWQQGFEHIAGVDEVGRGCLFGDVVAAAVILPKGLILEGVNDSKKLSEKKREELYTVIMNEAISVGIGIIDVPTINEINIKQASRLAMQTAVRQLTPEPDFILVDAENIDTPLPQMPLIHGDAVSQTIAAASIIAKVTRDRMCQEWDMLYPEYGIARHKGYATKQHREMLIEYGPTHLHRKLFIRNVMLVQQELF
ncbi:ribonuclease HII [Paenibacillus sp. FJAT-26967]|uniref:ribonuclease HII n=1 Tax=Paenibacillus sp. FJAT-26967 TaxID=1729690 RepID=UPI000837DCE7|nr:ribonuclease HII [Paenibacillus sp. FJAT-26967]